MFEFMFLDRPVVTYRTKMPGPYLIDVDDVGEVEAALTEAMEYPPQLMEATRALCDELHSFRDGGSSVRVMDAVGHFMEHQKNRLARKPLNLVRKLKVRRRLAREMRSNPF
jgi:CDP-glycerol glycerophosphotransferase (TagB/SpsB family)